MPRRHSIRSVVRSFLQRPRTPQGRRVGPSLSVTALEDRVVPAFVDVSGLRFDIPGNFATSPAPGGTKYDSAETFKVGLTPVGAAAFQPLFTLDGGGSVTDTGSAASPFTWNTGVSALTSGTPLPLFAGKADTQTVAETLPDAVAAAAAHPGEGQPVPLGPFTLTPSGFRVRSADQLGLAGSLGVADFGGVKLADVGLGKFVTAPADAAASFSAATVEGGFQLGANGGFNVGGLTFKAGANASQPNVGGYLRITTATGQVEVAGQAKVTIAGNPVDVSSGQYDVADASKFVPGAVFLAGVAQKFDLKVTTDLKLGGLTFTAKDLQGTYDRPAATFTLKGTAGFALKGNSVAVNFGEAATAGLVIADGTVKSAGFAVDSTLKLGGLTFTAKALAATFDSPTSMYTLKGTAGFDLKGNAVDVTFGDKTTAGLVIADGAVKSAAFVVNAGLKLGGLAFTAKDLEGTYDDATSTYTLKGTAGFALKGNTVSVNFGDAATAGLVVTDGTVKSAAFAVTADLKLGGLTFTAKSLAATYEDATSTYTLKGQAAFAFKDNTVAVTFGEKETAGLVIADGAVKSAAFAVDADLKLGGLTFTAKSLAATFDDATSTYTLKGTAAFAFKSNTVAVTFGEAETAGLVITDGTLKSAAFAVNADLKLGGLTFTAKPLAATYDDATSTYTVKGKATFEFKGNAVAVTLGDAKSAGLVIVDGGLKSLDFTVDSKLAVGKLVFTSKDLRFTFTDATNTYTLAGNARLDFADNFLDVNFGDKSTAGLVITDGKLVALAVTVNSKLTVKGVEITATDLTGTYDEPTDTLTLKGKASVKVKDSVLQLTLGTGDAAGVVIADGTLTKIDATVDSSFAFSNVTFTTKALRLTYDAAGGRFTVTGQATASFKVQGKDANLDVTFGLGDAPGLVIENGQLKQLTVAVTSNFTLLGLTVAIDKLSVNYVPATGEFGMFGTIRLSTAGAPGQRTLDDFSVKLGQGSFDAPGILVTDGSLSKLDIELNGAFKIAGLTVAPNKLNVRYDAATSLLRITGGLKVSLTEKFAAEATLPADQGGLTINTETGKVNVGGFKIKVSNVNFGTLKVNNLELSFAETAAGVDITGAASVTLPGSLTVEAGLKIVGGKLDSITLAVAKENPGIALFGGVFLTRISGEITGLADPANFTLKATVEMTVGPKVSFAGQKLALATIKGEIFLNAQKLQVSGTIDILEGKVGSGRGEVTVFFTGDTLIAVVVKDVQVLGAFKGDLSFTVTRSGDVTFDAKVSVRLPDGVPLVGGRELATAQLYLQIRPDQPQENSFGRVRVTFGPKAPDVTAESTGDFAADLAGAIAGVEAKARLRSADLNGDGVLDLVTWTVTGTLTVYDGATQRELFTTRPFGDGFSGDLHVTLGDLTGDRVPDLVVSPADSGAPRVRVYDGRDFRTALDFFGLEDTAFRGGTYTAVGDVNGDGVNDLVVTAGAGGAPRVAGYDGRTLASGTPRHLFHDFFAFDEAVRDGALALIRDLDGDGFGDLLLATPGGGTQVKALSGVDLMLNTIRAVTDRLEATAAAVQAQAQQAPAGGDDIQAQIIRRFIRSTVKTLSSGVNTVSEAAKRVAEEVKQKAEQAARAVRAAAEKAIEVAEKAISFTVALKVNFAGRVTGVAASGLGVEKRFDLQLPGSSASAQSAEGVGLAGFFDGTALSSALAAGDTVEDFTGYDLNAVRSPTVTVVGAAAVPGTPAGTVTFEGTSQFPADTTVDLFVTEKDKTYTGRRVATVPLGTGRQTYTIPDLAAFAPQPYDAARPLHVYAVINDNVSQPVYSDDTPAVLPGDYSLTLGGDAAGRSVRVLPGQPLAFGPGALGGALVVNDPLAAFLPDAQVEVTLQVNDGTLAVAASPGLAVTGDRSGLVTLTGTAAQVNVALGNVTYTPLNPAFRLEDQLLTTLSRSPRNDAGVVTPAPIGIDAVAVGVTLGGPAAYTQGSGPQPVLAAAAIESERTAYLTEATVAVGSYEPGRDFLDLAATPDITPRFDAGTGTLTLTGVTDVGQYAAALRAVTFRTTSSRPKPLSVTVDDDAGDQSSATLLVAVASATLPPPTPASAYTPSGDPDAAAVAIPTPAVDATPDGTPVAVTAGLTVTSPNSPTLSGAVVRVAGGFVRGEDRLAVTTLPAGVTANYDDFAGVLTLSGTAPVADYLAALAGVQYANRSHDRTAGTRAILVTVENGQGVSNAAAVTVAVTAAPVVSADDAVLTYTTGGVTAVLDAGVSVRYRSGLIDGATVAFVGDFDAASDVLGFAPASGIAGRFDPATGTLTLTGDATAAEYQAALRGVTYRSTEVNPEAYNRVVLFRATAGGLASDETGTVTVNVEPPVTPPTVTIPSGVVTVPERGGPTPVAPGLVIASVDPDQTTLRGASVTVDEFYSPDEDVVEYGPLPAGVTAAFDAANGELTFTGRASLAAYQALLRGVTYRNTNPGPVNPQGGLPVTFFLDDGSGASNSATVNVVVNVLNDAPASTGTPLPNGVSVPLGGGRKSLGLGGLNYAPPAGFTKLLVTVTSVPDADAVGTVRLADGTVVAAGSLVTLDQLRGAAFAPSPLALVGDTADFAFAVAGIADGAADPDTAVLAQSLRITIPGVTKVDGGGTVFATSSADGTVTLTNADGTPRNSLRPFDGAGGAVRTAVADFNADGTDDLVAATGPGVPTRLKVIDGATGAVLFAATPFEADFTGGAFVSAGDVTGDGRPDFAVTPDVGGGPRVRVFDGAAFAVVADFFGIADPDFRGGARTAIGDLTGDGVGDLVVAAGTGGGPRVAAYDGTTLGSAAVRKVFSDFFAFESGLLNGANVAVGDLNGDGVGDLVAGAGAGGGPRVRAFDGKALQADALKPLANFFSGDPASRGGVGVAVKALDGDEKADLVVGTPGRVAGYRSVRLSANGTPPESLGLDTNGGVYVG